MLALAPVLARLFSPEAFGVLSVFTSLAVAFGALSTGRYEFGILSVAGSRNKCQLFVNSLFTCFSFSLIVFVILLLDFDFLSSIQQQHFSQFPLLALPIGFLAIGLQQSFSHLALSQQRYKTLALAKLFQTMMFASLTVMLGLLAELENALIIGHLVGLFCSVIFILAVIEVPKFPKASLNISIIWYNAKKYSTYPMHVSLSDFISNLGFLLPPLIISMFFGVDKAGLFALAQRVLGSPLTFLGHAIGQVYLGESSRLLTENKTKFELLFFKVLILLACLIFVTLLPLTLFISKMSVQIFGNEWAQIGSVIYILFPMFACQFLASPLSNTLILMKKQSVLLLFDLAKLLCLVSMSSFVYLFNYSFYDLVYMLVWINSVYYILITVTPFFLLKIKHPYC